MKIYVFFLSHSPCSFSTDNFKIQILCWPWVCRKAGPTTWVTFADVLVPMAWCSRLLSVLQVGSNCLQTFHIRAILCVQVHSQSPLTPLWLDHGQVGRCCFPLHITSAALKSLCKQDCGTNPWQDRFLASPPALGSSPTQAGIATEGAILAFAGYSHLVKERRKAWPSGVSDV